MSLIDKNLSAFLMLAKRWLCVLILLLTPGSNSDLMSQQGSVSGPLPLTYGDLVALYENDLPSPELQARLTKLLNTAFVNNSFEKGHVITASATSENVVRIASWNIERGLEFDAIKAALTNDQRFFRGLTPARRPTKPNLAAVLDQSMKKAALTSSCSMKLIGD